MKGKQLLYNDIVTSSLGQAQTNAEQNLNRRHDAMACRYHYHANIKRLRYDDCLLSLSKEFFLSPLAVVSCLKKRNAYIRRLAVQQATPSELRKLFPHYNW